MTFSERMKGLLDQGITVSKGFAVKAGAKAQDLGERGILMIEIKQLEGQAQKALSRMGNETYRMFVERNETSINRDEPEFKSILEELAVIREAIDKRELELKDRKGS